MVKHHCQQMGKCLTMIPPPCKWITDILECEHYKRKNQTEKEIFLDIHIVDTAFKKTEGNGLKDHSISAYFTHIGQRAVKFSYKAHISLQTQ